ncbi:uncharacterized protein SCHCODRAFT_02703345 [Schizophyllum commune H4-8]|uniref:Uncharacterized protein n=1 Tax=Schizophyllum commune (strain H4-8 / FGSC 9210) TaxID=578458 RepID=D8Q8F6_SCHCM|nr:uncharacterized protein SCHCODRAFT_02703345 [Schizophyllum commune H4-8]KAI5890834.1 hypothetical protein SCHCODRAFT_02703345 [Schizophyllum commune H4-8]
MPWGLPPPPNPFAAQPPVAPPNWHAAFPQLFSLLQQAPWLFAPGWGAVVPTLQPQPIQLSATSTGPPGSELVSTATDPVATSTAATSPTLAPGGSSVDPPTAPRAMRSARPGTLSSRPLLHSRIAGAPPAHTLEDRLTDLTPSRAASLPPAKRPASSLLDRLASGTPKRARPSPPSPPHEPTSPTHPPTSAVDTPGDDNDAASRKRGRRGGGAGNRRRRRRKACRLTQQAQEGASTARKDNDDEDDYGDADSFVHRPDTPDSGAAM